MDGFPRTANYYVKQDEPWEGEDGPSHGPGNSFHQQNFGQMGDFQKRDDSKTNLIVNYLPQSMTEKDLYSMFVTIGPVESCRVMKDFKTGYSYGFGFVNFTKADDASRAIGTLNGLQVQNKRLKVSFARPSGEEIKETNLYVTNLPRTITEQYLDMLFGKYGHIVQKNLLKDKVTGMPRGVAFVRYDRREEAQEAINSLNGVVPDNGTEPLVVKIAEEHGKQKAAYYAGWQAGYNQSRGSARGGRGLSRGGGDIVRGGGVMRGAPMRGGSGVMRGGGSMRGGAMFSPPPGSQGGMFPPPRGGGVAFARGARGSSQFPPPPGNFAAGGVMRLDKSHNRFNPMGMGYNLHGWN